jgi:hypothetical protein
MGGMHGASGERVQRVADYALAVGTSKADVRCNARAVLEQPCRWAHTLFGRPHTAYIPHHRGIIAPLATSVRHLRAPVACFTAVAC